MPYWGVHSTTVVGYTYEADHHCCICAEERFPNLEVDRETLDREGNPVTPVFADQAWDDDGGQDLHCGTCGDSLIASRWH